MRSENCIPAIIQLEFFDIELQYHQLLSKTNKLYIILLAVKC